MIEKKANLWVKKHRESSGCVQQKLLFWKILQISAKFTGKQLCGSVSFFNKVASCRSVTLFKKVFQHRCFPFNLTHVNGCFWKSVLFLLIEWAQFGFRYCLQMEKCHHFSGELSSCPEVFYKKRCLQNFRKIHRKTRVLEAVF